MLRRSYGVVVILLTMLLPSLTGAATLYMSPQSVSLDRADSATISVRLDVDEDECINVVDAVIQFPDTIVPVDVSRGSSILSLWVEEPVIDLERNVITFAGGIPNGYCGRIVGDPRLTNNIVDIVVQSPSFVVGNRSSGTTTAAELTFAPETQLLRNDNFGTAAEATLVGTTITLSKRAGQGDSEWLEVVQNDTTPPNDFVITLERTPNAFSNQYFITFNTTDKQSGLDHYEVIEEPLDELPFFSWGREDAPWRKVRSPYVLQDQSLNSVIRVRAIDKAGNETIATLIPDDSIRTMSDSTKMALVVLAASIVVLGIVMGVTAWLITRRRSGGKGPKRRHRGGGHRDNHDDHTTPESATAESGDNDVLPEEDVDDVDDSDEVRDANRR